MFFVPQARIEDWIGEDLGLVDLTVDALGIEGKPGTVEAAPKKDCVVAGTEEAARMFAQVGACAEAIRPSGSALASGTPCLRAHGTAGQLHAAYKAAQNVMEYASGIATRTARLVRSAKGAAPDVEVAVTRKHFPGTKPLSLKAALAGGATVHRMGLSESILVFDQHRVFTGGVEGFLERVPEIARRFPEKKIMAEAASFDEALAFARAGVQVVQCERFSPADLKVCVERLKAAAPGVTVTAAGGVNADNAADYAATGVDALVTSWVYFGKPEDIRMTFCSSAK